MKKLIGVLLALMLLIGIVALAEPVASDSTATESAAAEIVETVEETAEEVNEAVEGAIETAEEQSGGFLDGVAKVNGVVNGIVWGAPALVLLAFVGVLMTLLTKVFQLTHIGHWMKKTIGAVFSDKHVTGHTADKSISQFQSLCTALAATVGTGNIVGVSDAIMVGGPGAVFWMWVIAFFGMMTNYSENVLGIYYRRKNSKGEWAGGAMYYLRDGLGDHNGLHHVGKALAWLFSLFCLIASFGIGNMTQVNSISGNMQTVFHVPTWVTGVVVMVRCSGPSSRAPSRPRPRAAASSATASSWPSSRA